MKLLSFHEVTSIHKLAVLCARHFAARCRSNRAQKTPDHLATASSCFIRQTVEAGDGRLPDLSADHHNCRSVEPEILCSLSITAVYSSSYKSVVTFVENVTEVFE